MNESPSGGFFDCKKKEERMNDKEVYCLGRHFKYLREAVLHKELIEGGEMCAECPCRTRGECDMNGHLDIIAALDKE